MKLRVGQEVDLQADKRYIQHASMLSDQDVRAAQTVGTEA